MLVLLSSVVKLNVSLECLFDSSKMKLQSVLLFLKAAAFLREGSKEENFAYCESYNAVTCDNPNKKDCYTQKKCGPITADRHNHCFTLWEHNSDTGASEVQMKGCFLNNKDCYEKSHCTERIGKGDNQLYFCCCNGQMCNQNITYENMLIKKQDVVPISDMEFQVFFTQNVFHVLVPILATLSFFVAIIIFISCLYCQQCKSGKLEISKAELGQSDKLTTIVSAQQSLPQLQHVNETSHQSNTQLLDASMISTELIEKKASGRFGAIWKARRSNGETVAVKVFPLREKQSWRTELNVFQLPGMNHEDLLRFVGACRVGDSLEAEFWLLTDYCDRGSLYDYLRENTITWEELSDITISIARGLKHLHEEQRDPDTDSYKPAIAHRDFKSKNVLLSGSDPMRVCIADFNLALVIQDGGRSVSQCSRVGTLRYMAPEVLDGAINFRKDAILTIDMYAFALVLWELVSRCVIDENPVSDYQIPFQADVGLKPGLAEMHNCVVHKRLRPSIKDTWRQNSNLAVICNVIEECWDHDPDARISSSTVLERITSFRKSL